MLCVLLSSLSRFNHLPLDCFICKVSLVYWFFWWGPIMSTSAPAVYCWFLHSHVKRSIKRAGRNRDGVVKDPDVFTALLSVEHSHLVWNNHTAALSFVTVQNIQLELAKPPSPPSFTSVSLAHWCASVCLWHKKKRRKWRDRTCPYAESYDITLTDGTCPFCSAQFWKITVWVGANTFQPIYSCGFIHWLNSSLWCGVFHPQWLTFSFFVTRSSFYLRWIIIIFISFLNHR